jgi:heme oxygenase
MTDHKNSENSGLADLMKSETWDLHTEAETTGFINQILRGTASLPHYISFLKNLQPIYEAMESSYEWLESYPTLSAYMGHQIARSDSIAFDLEHLTALCKGPVCSAIFESTRHYQANVNTALTENHAAMLAHIYVRYLGDLNGGLVLQKLLGKHLELPTECLTFYSFPKIDNLSEFKSSFREALNNLSLDHESKRRSVVAARTAFSFNIELSRTLES